jgi:hypothetical protein
MYNEYRSAQDTHAIIQTIALDALPASLPGLVFGIIAPLYELFDFFKLPKRLVEDGLASMLSNRF